eukprot:CAMPEP_0178417534 /NCGR_PEP_ID=MMETSP0689_2-20121128/24622_1 /TAXON_ID=160604 /ORGANISM="Amphidinium massartii, Strain CS-259" /LENGTH=522 /DNA_ID=CAMNT_0020038899 /DNA_START=133 /DNA_END=1697 /DNA_ORIENTATION=-
MAVDPFQILLRLLQLDDPPRGGGQARAAVPPELSPVHNDFPRAMVKSGHIDEDAVEVACASLANSVVKGNLYQFEALTVVLRNMMPPQTGASNVRGPPPPATIEKANLVWSEQDYMSGPQENLRILQGYEAEYARRVSLSDEGFRDPQVLEGALDLAVAYLKNYAVDKADMLYAAIEPYCMERGLPWDVKWLQDCATLRCKQARQEEAAVLLEEVAKRTPPHPATLINLGTVYNMLRQHDKAEEYFQAAMEVAGHSEPQKDDLWNMGIAKKNKGEYEEALPMLERALEEWIRDDPDDDVTIAKLHDTVGSCYDLMGRHDDAVEQFSRARELFGRSIGAESPLYGSACEGLTKALVHAGRWEEAFNRLEETLLNAAEKDAVHPTPLYELLGLALEDLLGQDHITSQDLARLEYPIEVAVKNMIHRRLDQDGNAGVVFERMAQVLLRCSIADGDRDQHEDAARRRALARYLLQRAGPLVQACTESGEADLSEYSLLIELELQALDAQDAIYQKRLGGTEQPRWA